MVYPANEQMLDNAAASALIVQCSVHGLEQRTKFVVSVEIMMTEKCRGPTEAAAQSFQLTLAPGEGFGRLRMCAAIAVHTSLVVVLAGGICLERFTGSCLPVVAPHQLLAFLDVTEREHGDLHIAIVIDNSLRQVQVDVACLSLGGDDTA